MLDFSALLSKVLFTFAFVVFGLDYDLHVAFYVGFRNFCKTNTDNHLKLKEMTNLLLVISFSLIA